MDRCGSTSSLSRGTGCEKRLTAKQLVEIERAMETLSALPDEMKPVEQQRKQRTYW